MRILGIDPGLNGGVAVLFIENGRVIGTHICPIPIIGEDAKRRVYTQKLCQWIKDLEPDVGFIERAGVMPRQGNASGFLYGRAVGAIEATVCLAGVPLYVIEPAVWKRHFGLLGCDKEQSRQAVFSVLSGSEKLLPRKKHHGMAEAILLALFGADHVREYIHDTEPRAIA